jgi:MFS family permease
MAGTLRKLLPKGGLWRHRDFLSLWSAETISQFGSQVTLLALPFVAILALDATTFQVALLTTLEFLPFILVSLPAGVWVDRFPRRPVLIIGDVGRAALLASVPIAYALDVLTLEQLYVVGFATGVFTVFFDVAYQAYLPSLVDREQLVEGNSKLEVSRAGAQIGGPAVAGGLIEALTAPVAVLVDALSFLGSALFLFRIRKREEIQRSDEARPSMRKELSEGLRYVLGHPLLRPIAICTGSSNFFGNVAFAIFIVFAVRELGLTAGVVGLVFALGNVGWLAAAVLAGRIAGRFGVGRTIVGSGFLFGPALLLVPLAPEGNAAIPFLVASGVISGFGVVLYNIQQVSLRQAITPERIQGRMNAVMRFLVWGTIPLGGLTGGALASWIGLRETLWVAAIAGTFTVLPVLLSPVRSLKRIPEHEPTEPRLTTAPLTAEPAPTAPDA